MGTTTTMIARNTGPGSAVGGRAGDQAGITRAVALVGPAGTGKTSLAEALLYASGAINRQGSVEAGTTKGRDAKRTGIAAGAGAVIGAIAGGGKGAAIGAGAGAAAGVVANMATRGQAAEIPTETLIEFTLSAPATVVFRK